MTIEDCPNYAYAVGSAWQDPQMRRSLSGNRDYLEVKECLIPEWLKQDLRNFGNLRPSNPVDVKPLENLTLGF